MRIADPVAIVSAIRNERQRSVLLALVANENVVGEHLDALTVHEDERVAGVARKKKTHLRSVTSETSAEPDLAAGSPS